MQLFTVLIIIISIATVIIVLFAFSIRKSKKGPSAKQQDRQTIIRDANRKLAQNPHNPQGLKALSDLYFNEHLWDKAYPFYELMTEIAPLHPEMNVGEVGLRMGICALKQNKPTEAFKGLLIAKKNMSDSFEANFYLGQALMLNKEYEKAIPLLRKALVINPENIETYRFLGLSLYRIRSFKESLSYLKRALDAAPEDKELLFAIAEALLETGNGDRALKIFMHLRPNPEFGARASLNSGTIHFNANKLDLAIQDFEIGLKHPNLQPDIAVQLRYKLAQTFLKINNIARALAELKTIQSIAPNYKDVPTLIAQYQELNQNKNLQIYLIANNSDFVALCRKLVVVFFKDAKVNIVDLNVQTDNTEVLTEIDTGKWQDVVIFRFYRTTGSTGELFIRDFHGKVRDTKSGKGICFTAGSFSQEAKNYTEGRPIELIDKIELTKILAKIETSANALIK